jgi:hypothetical protein
MSELKPCPFCGSLPVENFDNDPPYIVSCVNTDCFVRPSSFYAGYSEDAIKFWNARTTTKPKE